MAQELIYTSAPKGLREGSSGFCVVAYTRGMPANLVQLLESLSAYKPVFPHYDKNSNLNPVSYSHYKTSIGSTPIHILSRICFAGLDYSKRSNKLAHHLVFDVQERIKCGPAVVFRVPDLFLSKWESDPGIIEQQKRLGEYEWPLRKAATWEQVTGDAGWAGVLADSFMKTPDKTAFIIFDPNCNVDTMSMVDEALMLLRPEDRWQVSFNTYFTSLPPSVQCNWRFCVPDSDALKEARRQPGALIIDLTKPMERAPDGLLAERARTGEIKISKPLSSIIGVKLDQAGMNVDEPERKKMPSLQMPSPQMQPYRKPAIVPARTRTPARIQAPSNQATLQIDEGFSQKQKLIVAAIIVATIAVIIFLFFHITGSNKENEAVPPEKAANNFNIQHNSSTQNTGASPKATDTKNIMATSGSGQPANPATPPPPEGTALVNTSTNNAEHPQQQTPKNKQSAEQSDKNAEQLRKTFWKSWAKQMENLKNAKNNKTAATLTPSSQKPLEINIPLELTGPASIEIKLKSDAKSIKLENSNPNEVIGQLNVSSLIQDFKPAFNFSIKNGQLVIKELPLTFSPDNPLAEPEKRLEMFASKIEQYVINGKSYYPDFTPGYNNPLEKDKGVFRIVGDTFDLKYKLSEDDTTAKLPEFSLELKANNYTFDPPKFIDNGKFLVCRVISNEINLANISLKKAIDNVEAAKSELKQKCAEIIKPLKMNLGGDDGILLLTADLEVKYEQLKKLSKKITESKSKNPYFSLDDLNNLNNIITNDYLEKCDNSQNGIQDEINKIKKDNPNNPKEKDGKLKNLDRKKTDVDNLQKNVTKSIKPAREKYKDQIKQMSLIQQIYDMKKDNLDEVDNEIKKKLEDPLKNLKTAIGSKEDPLKNLKTAKDKLLIEKEILVKMSKKIKNNEGQEAEQLVKEITFKKE